MTTPTASSEGVRNALATRAEAGVVQSEQGMTTAQMVTKAIDRQADAFRAVLPAHVDHERFARLVLTAIKGTPRLLECFATPQGEVSVLLSAMQAAALGLEPNTPTQEAWLLPRNSKVKVDGKDVWIVECELSIGYRGYIKLARRAQPDLHIVAEVVRAKDHFVYRRGMLSDTLEHEVYDGPDAEDETTNPVVKAYAIGRHNGTADCRVVSLADIHKRRAMSESWKRDQKNGWAYSPWTKWFDEMARKTGIRMLVPYLDLSAEVMEAVNMDERPIGFDAVNGTLRVIESSARQELESGEVAPEPDPPPVSVEQSPDSAFDMEGFTETTLPVENVRIIDAGSEPVDVELDIDGMAEKAGVATGKALIEARKIAKRLGVDPPTELADVKGTAVGRELAEWFRAQTSATANREPQPEVDPQPEGDGAITEHTRNKLFAMFGEIVGGADADQRSKMLGLAWILGETNLQSRTEITEALAQEMITTLDGMKVSGLEIIRKADGAWDLQARPVASATKSAARTRKAAATADDSGDKSF